MKALYYILMAILIMGSVWGVNYAVASFRYRKLANEVSRLRKENERLKGDLEGSEDAKDRRIGQYERMIDALQYNVASWRGNELSLSDSRRFILDLIEAHRPSNTNEGNLS